MYRTPRWALWAHHVGPHKVQPLPSWSCSEDPPDARYSGSHQPVVNHPSNGPAVSPHDFPSTLEFGKINALLESSCTLTARLVRLQDRQFSVAQKSSKALVEGY